MSNRFLLPPSEQFLIGRPEKLIGLSLLRGQNSLLREKMKVLRLLHSIVVNVLLIAPVVAICGVYVPETSY